MANKLLKTLNFGGEDTYHIGWESLQNPPFCVEGMQTVEILPPTELFHEDDMFGVMALIEGVEIGETYTVNYNGVDYESTAQLFEGDGNTVTVLGNMGAVVGSGDNGQPFVLMILPPEAFAEASVGGLFMPLDGATSVTLSIKSEVEKIKKLDNKFIDAEWIAKHSKSEVVLYDDTLTIDSIGMLGLEEILFNAVEGKKYEITYNGTIYNCVGKLYEENEQTQVALGNLSLRIKDAYGTPAGPDTGEPFLFFIVNTDSTKGTIIISTIRGTDVSILVVEKTEVPNKLPYKFNTEPIIFTTADMLTATCNKTYQECVEAINNNFFTGYMVNTVGGEKSIGPFNGINVRERDLEFMIIAGTTVATFKYDMDNIVTISLNKM